MIKMLHKQYQYNYSNVDCQPNFSALTGLNDVFCRLFYYFTLLVTILNSTMRFSVILLSYSY